MAEKKAWGTRRFQFLGREFYWTLLRAQNLVVLEGGDCAGVTANLVGGGAR